MYACVFDRDSARHRHPGWGGWRIFNNYKRPHPRKRLFFGFRTYRGCADGVCVRLGTWGGRRVEGGFFWIRLWALWCCPDAGGPKQTPQPPGPLHVMWLLQFNSKLTPSMAWWPDSRSFLAAHLPRPGGLASTNKFLAWTNKSQDPPWAT